MPQKYKVVQGDCLSSIAKKFGFVNYRTIYNDPANAAFKKKRPNPNIIYPGDMLVIPDHKLKEYSEGTEQRHKYVLEVDHVKLRLEVKSDEDKPLANMRYELKVDGKTHSGSTDGEGKIEQEIAADAAVGELVLYPGEGDQQNVFGIFSLELGHLDPVEEASGVQARLNNLGYYCGAVDGVIGAMTQAALRDFQSDNGLPVSGAADSATQTKLRQLHDWE